MTVRDPVESVRQNRVVTEQTTAYAHPYYWAPFVLIGARR